MTLSPSSPQEGREGRAAREAAADQAERTVVYDPQSYLGFDPQAFYVPPRVSEVRVDERHALQDCAMEYAPSASEATDATLFAEAGQRIGVGPVFGTQTKEHAPPPLGLAELAAIVRAVHPLPVIAIGNAPTALFHLIDLINAGAPRPAAVLGIPVGFIGAQESKEALAATDLEHLVVHGRRGGSAMTAAAINAIASEEE